MSSFQQKCQPDNQGYGLTFFFAVAIYLALDQWTKYLVSTQMQIGQTITLPVSFVQLTYVRNFGGAFGVLADAQVVFVASALLALGCIYWQFPAICAHTGKWGCGISAAIAAGALGNLCDRLRLGYVVDMIDLKWWPVFNVADIGITVGITLMVFWLSRMSSDSEDDQPDVQADSCASNDVGNE